MGARGGASAAVSRFRRVALAPASQQEPERPGCEASLQTSLPHCPADTVLGAVGRGPCTHCIPGEALEEDDMTLLLEGPPHVGLGYRNSCGF